MTLLATLPLSETSILGRAFKEGEGLTRNEKINQLQAITFDEESAGDAENGVAPPKQAKRLEDFSKFFNLEIFFALKNQKLQIV